MAICTKLPHFFSICLIPICNDHFLCDPTSYFGPHLKFRIYMRFAFSTSSAYHYFDLKINTWLWDDEGYLSSAIVSLLDLNKKLLTIPIAFSTSTIPKLSFQKLEWFVRNCSYSCSLRFKLWHDAMSLTFWPNWLLPYLCPQQTKKCFHCGI